MEVFPTKDEPHNKYAWSPPAMTVVDPSQWLSPRIIIFIFVQSFTKKLRIGQFPVHNPPCISRLGQVDFTFKPKEPNPNIKSTKNDMVPIFPK